MKYSCVNPDGTRSTTNVADWFPADEYVDKNLDEFDCIDAGGKWEGFKWDGKQPECVDSYWTKVHFSLLQVHVSILRAYSQVNYLGNADGTANRGGKQAHYDWNLPSWDELTNGHMCWTYSEKISYPAAPTGNNLGTAAPDATSSTETDAQCVRMVFRIRYNMSTMDYDPYKTNSTHDYEPQQGILSPIEENPEVDVGFYVQGLQLAINTAQTGRTFQDRTHTFLVCQRDSTAAWANKPLLNVNVRGKRGNIVQTFPATEYDFEPQHVELKPTSGQCLHFQWCGSNTHNNGNPGGDGQTGDDGQGRGGSDRSNLVQMRNMDESYPVTYDKIGEDDDFFEYVDCYHPFRPEVTVSKADAQLVLGTAGFYKGENYMKKACEKVTDDAAGQNRGMCIVDELLNNVSASFRAGLICCLKNDLESSDGYERIFAFLSTRNNNFTNRSQKFQIKLSSSPDSPALW